MALCNHCASMKLAFEYLLRKTAPASAVLITKVAYDAVDGLINMVASSYTSEGVLK